MAGFTKERPEMRFDDVTDMATHIETPANAVGAQTAPIRKLIGRGLGQLKNIMGTASWYTPPPTDLTAVKANMDGQPQLLNEARNIRMIGGGTISWGVTTDKFKWTERFKLLPVPVEVSSDYYVSIGAAGTGAPTSGVTDNASVERANASGITINDNEALWFVHVKGGGNATGNSFKVLPYNNVATDDYFEDDTGWGVIIAIRSGDDDVLHLRNGLKLAHTTTVDPTGYLPRLAGSANPLIGDLFLGTGSQVDFFDELGEKLYYFSTTYSTGLSASSLYHRTGGFFRIHASGDTPGTTTPRMEVDTSTNTMKVNGFEVWHEGNGKGFGVIARLATTANINLATVNLTAMDGKTPAVDDVVFVKNQTTASENGLYLVRNGSAWVRAPFADTSAKMKPGLLISVSEGTANGNTLWQHTTDGPITLGTTALTFGQFTGGGGGASPATDAAQGTVRLRTAAASPSDPIVVAPNDADYMQKLYAVDILEGTFAVPGNEPVAAASLTIPIPIQTFYIAGQRYQSPANAGKLFTANSDIYIEVAADGVLDYKTVANNGAAPAIDPGHVRILKVVTGLSAVTRVQRRNPPEIDVRGMCNVYRNSNAAFSAGAFKLPFNSVDFDAEGWFDTTTNEYKPQIPGWYHFMWQVTATFSAAFFFETAVYRNGVLAKRGSTVYVNAAATNVTSLGSQLIFCNGVDDVMSIYSINAYAGTMISGVTASYWSVYRARYFPGAY